jgi:hypothetical protein
LKANPQTDAQTMLTSKTSFILFLLLPSLLLQAEGDYRTFTNDMGSTIEAKITEASDQGSVTLERRDGRTFKDVDITLFSNADQKYINKWRKKQAAKYDDADLKPDSRIALNVLKKTTDNMNDYGDIDDRIVSFQPSVVADNQEVRFSFKSVQGTLIIIGENIMDNREYVILNRQNFKLNLPKTEKVRWDGSPFECRYDPDYGGFEYGGYLVALKNKAGKVVQVKASKSIWERNAGKIIKAKKRTGYSRDFEQSHKLRTTFGLN